MDHLPSSCRPLSEAARSWDQPATRRSGGEGVIEVVTLGASGCPCVRAPPPSGRGGSPGSEPVSARGPLSQICTAGPVRREMVIMEDTERLRARVAVELQGWRNGWAVEQTVEGSVNG